ncbi:MAG: hypothetical protein GY842_24220, partial [bacterium]|nr:hypothetical protein [bacterium]
MIVHVGLCSTMLAFNIMAAVSAAAVIVDNDDGAPAYTETGGWTTSGSAGYDGGTYRFASAGGSHTATWTGNLSEAGDYEVFVWYTPGSNRATSAKYIIAAADGPHTVFINQTGAGYTFESLGTFTFNAGDNSITLDASGSSGGDVVIADAVRFGDDEEPPPPPVTEEVAPGVYHSTYTLATPQVNHVLEFDLTDPRYTIEMGFSQGKRNYSAKETVTQIASHYDSTGHEIVGAVNCSYFEAGLGILGMLGTTGNLVSSRDDAWWDQQTYMLQQSGAGWAASDLTAANMVARFADDAEVQINILDYPCTASAINLYTPDWDSSTKSTSQGVEIIVEGVNYPLRPNKELVGTITAVHTGSASLNNSIPTDGFVLAACPGAESTLLAHAVVGDLVSVRFEMTPLDLVNLQALCTGNAWMVKDGVPYHGGGPERHPRTVIAWSGAKHWFVTFDGRQTGYAVGASVAEMQDFLINVLEVENAINLDGGGSTTMVVNGSVANCPSDGATTPCTGTQRALPNALLLVDRDATTEFPLTEEFGSSGRVLSWDEKFGFNPVKAFSPSAPDGDGYVLELLNSNGEYETASVGAPGDANYAVEAWVYCEYRPGVAGDGFERAGIFVRDDGNANFDRPDLGGGNCYSLTYDSNTGRIRAGVVVDGVLTDFLESSPVYAPTSAWRKLGIECFGAQLEFRVDDSPLAEVTDGTHPWGRIGVGYSEYFGDDANIHGARVDRFSATSDFPGDADGDGDVD